VSLLALREAVLLMAVAIVNFLQVPRAAPSCSKNAPAAIARNALAHYRRPPAK
jgi:hypothetical protein